MKTLQAWGIITGKGELLEDHIRIGRNQSIHSLTTWNWKIYKKNYGYRCIKVKIEYEDKE